VLVTSAVPDEGKTALALTLGRTGAASGQRVLLIDCDLRAPSVATDLGTTCGKGLAELLTSEATINEVVRIDPLSGLRFIAAGRGSFDAIELLSSGRMQSIIAAARQVSDTVILDSPPVTLVSDPLALSRVADLTLMVVRWDRTPRSLVAEAMKKLAAAKALPTGIVLSQVNLARHASYGFGDFPHGYLKGYLSG
jgi:capsular exopolysaccharide synthesis family protein